MKLFIFEKPAEKAALATHTRTISRVGFLRHSSFLEALP